MRLVIAAVGRLKAGSERELVARYVERCGQMGRGIALSTPEIVELDESRARNAHLRKRDEAERLLGVLPEKCALIALDETGKTQTSQAFAADLARRRDQGVGAVAFIIGGADGLGLELFGQSDFLLAFGAMTWPHQIVRLLLAEQLYRAATILAGHPYHRV